MFLISSATQILLQKHINVGTTYKALGFKKEKKNQIKIYKNEMMIMREKHMRKKNWKYKKRIKFCEKKNDDDRTRINEFEG